MPGMKMPGCPDTASQQPSGGQPGQAPNNAASNAAAQGDLMTMRPQTFLQGIVHHAGSGTSFEPVSTPTPMLMTVKRGWMLMLHGNAFVLDQQQSGARGGDKFFSTNWAMGMAQHAVGRGLGGGVFTVRAMISLEPATITGRRYPLLFQQGETAFGAPIADGQHPHDLFMELAALYDMKIGGKGLLSFYAAPIGDPALGPAAYPHRASAAENPLATLGHHQQDSTHIAADVVTVGLAYGMARMEASGFHGREPDENRWNINQGKIDSWSARFTLAPGKDWSGQFSYGRITSPEALAAGENQERMTASVMYNRPFASGNWASSAVWGRTQSISGGASGSAMAGVIFNSYLLESTMRFRRRYAAWTRIENADRSNELILGEQPPPAGFEERRAGRVQAYTLGFDRDFDFVPYVATAIGAQVTVYGVPDSLRAIYGARPAGIAMFVRLRPSSTVQEKGQ